MTDEEFGEPAPLDSIKWADIDGRLVLITPQELKTDVPNVDGTGVRDVIYGRVVILDGPGAPDIYDRTPVYPRYLQGQVRPYIGTGRSALGRVTKDTTRQKAGRHAPWILSAATDADKRLARDYLAAQARGSVGGSATTGHPPLAPHTTPEPPF